MPDIAFVNGHWSALSEAKIPIEDRGFQFGDGVYEVVRTYGKAVFGLQNHLSRLQRSAAAIQISLPYDLLKLEALVQTGCERAAFGDVLIYIQITRGIARRAHAFPAQGPASLVMTFRETKRIPQEVQGVGVSVISTEDIRWGRCNIKSLNLLPNVLAREKAKETGAFEALFVRGGAVQEGAGSNVFAVLGEKLVTPPLGPFILSGITREVLLDLGAQEGLEVSESVLPLQTLRAADEVFLTGTTIEVLPVVKLDGQAIGSGRPGKITQALAQRFLAFTQA